MADFFHSIPLKPIEAVAAAAAAALKEDCGAKCGEIIIIVIIKEREEIDYLCRCSRSLKLFSSLLINLEPAVCLSIQPATTSQAQPEQIET